MKYIRTRNIVIDVNPSISSPYVSMHLERVTLGNMGQEVQVEGQFDRITGKLFDLQSVDATDHLRDGLLTPEGLFVIVAKYASQWVIEKHGGFEINNVIVVEL